MYRLSQFRRLIILLVILAIVGLFQSCNKEKYIVPQTTPDGLPVVTQTGANTFGCLLNDTPWIAQIKCWCHWCTKIEAEFNDSTHILNIYASNIFGDCLTDYFHQTMDISIANPGKGDFIHPEVDFTLHLNNQNVFFPYFKLDTLSPHVVTITKFDLKNKIVSGTFYLNVKNVESVDVWQLSSGRFDIPFVIR